MGQERRLLFPTHYSSSLASLALPHVGKQDPNLISKTCVMMDKFPTLGSYPVSQSHFDGSDGWIYGSSHLKQQFLPPQNPCLNQMPFQVVGECTHKRFLVFDQSEDQKTMLLTSNIRKSFETLKQPNMNEELRRSNKDLIVCQGIQEISEPDLKEDTEELNALLYSEDESDYFSEEDEVTSSGHSPSTLVSAHEDQERFSQSHGQYVKKRKIAFLKTSNENMQDAESSCGSCNNTEIGCPKRSKMFSNKIGEEKIFETVSLLRSIVPGEELVDPILVIDRAIDYLRSLKMEAEDRGQGTLCLQDS